MPTRDGKHAYSDEDKAEIIAHVLVNVACGRPVLRIFNEDDLTEQGIPLPDERTFWKWLFADPSDEIGQKLARAREFGVEALIDRAMVMAQDTMIGEEITEEPVLVDGKQVATSRKTKRGDMTAHRKLYIETMFKAAQMLKPKKYGAKLDLTSDGKQLGAVEALEAARERVRRMLDEDKKGMD
jgi:hypothetical protein